MAIYQLQSGEFVMEKESLEPRITDNIKILIMGSMPGEVSLEQQRYYANKGNDFWKLVGNALGLDLVDMEYEDKIRQLNSNGIGLWDIYKHCQREGSLDADINNAEFNDFSVLKDLKNLRIICLNGKEAGKKEVDFLRMGYNTKVLPSSSGANRRNNEQRFAEWRDTIQEFIK